MKRLIDTLLSYAKNYRLELMGVAITWVMMLHGSELYSTVRIPIVSTIAKRGNIGVDMFLFLSGFGLWFSLEKNNDTIAFYRRRVKRVLLPYLILAFPFWIYNTLYYKAGFSKFLMDYMGISFVTQGVVTTWYIFLIIALYLVYPLIYHWEKKSGLIADAAMIVACISFCIVLKRHLPSLYGHVEIAITRVPAFLLGSLAARLTKQKNKAEYVFFASYAIFATAIFILHIPIKKSNLDLSVVLYRFGGAGIAVMVITVFSVFYDRISKWRGGFRSKLLQHLGIISLELYLLHIFLRTLLRHNKVGIHASALQQSFIWFLTIVIAVVLSTMFHYLYERIGNRKAIGEKRK